MADRIIVLSERPGTVKCVIDVNLTLENKTPFNSRSAPEFNSYFNQIWKELVHHATK